jgi:hypothetical protein
MITLPTGAITDVTAYIGDTVSDVWVLIALAIGLPLAFYVIKRLIGLLPKGK